TRARATRPLATTPAPLRSASDGADLKEPFGFACDPLRSDLKGSFRTLEAAMAPEARKRITEPAALDALAHPVRLDLMNYLRSSGPAPASACARAVGDTPSNCSYHLRTLAKFGLVGEVPSADGRERPWRALVTGLITNPDDPKEPLSPQAA